MSTMLRAFKVNRSTHRIGRHRFKQGQIIVSVTDLSEAFRGKFSELRPALLTGSELLQYNTWKDRLGKFDIVKSGRKWKVVDCYGRQIHRNQMTKAEATAYKKKAEKDYHDRYINPVTAGTQPVEVEEDHNPIKFVEEDFDAPAEVEASDSQEDQEGE